MIAAQRGELGGWRSRTTFVLALSASAVGLGNLWRFSYLAGENGGALFVLTYLPFFGDEEPPQPYPALQAYWSRVGGDEHAARVIAEIRTAMQARAQG